MCSTHAFGFFRKICVSSIVKTLQYKSEKKLPGLVSQIKFIKRARALLLCNFMPLGEQKPLIWTFIIQIHFVPALSFRLMNWHS